MGERNMAKKKYTGIRILSDIAFILVMVTIWFLLATQIGVNVVNMAG